MNWRLVLVAKQTANSLVARLVYLCSFYISIFFRIFCLIFSSYSDRIKLSFRELQFAVVFDNNYDYKTLIKFSFLHLKYLVIRKVFIFHVIYFQRPSFIENNYFDKHRYNEFCNEFWWSGTFWNHCNTEVIFKVHRFPAIFLFVEVVGRWIGEREGSERKLKYTGSFEKYCGSEISIFNSSYFCRVQNGKTMHGVFVQNNETSACRNVLVIVSADCFQFFIVVAALERELY